MAIHAVGIFASGFHEGGHEVDGALVQGVGDDGTGEGVVIGIEGAVSAAFEVGSEDAGPGVGENAEWVDAEEDGEGREAEEELSFGFQLAVEAFGALAEVHRSTVKPQLSVSKPNLRTS